MSREEILFEVDGELCSLNGDQAWHVAAELNRLHLDELDTDPPGHARSASIAIQAAFDSGEPVRLTESEAREFARVLEATMILSRPTPPDGLAVLNAYRRSFGDPELEGHH